MAIRYYLHGDRHEIDPDKFYCRACDFSFPESHFSEHGTELRNRKNNYQLLVSTRKTWKVVKKRSPRYYRPFGAPNLFAHVP